MLEVRNPQDFADRYIVAGGINTHYLEWGNADAPAVVLIHGGGAGADAFGNWRVVAPILARRFRVIAVEMVGFGKTEKPDPANYVYSQANRVNHITAFLREMKLEPARLVGNSMGGATALGVAMDHPDLVSRLVLMGSSGLNAELTEGLSPIINYDFSREGMRRIIEALTAPGFEITEELLDLRFALASVPETRQAYAAIMGWIKQSGGLFYPEDAIAKVKTKTLVVNGKLDLQVPIAHTYKFLELLENSWGYIIPHCGHWAMIEAPEDFAGATARFLEEDWT